MNWKLLLILLILEKFITICIGNENSNLQSLYVLGDTEKGQLGIGPFTSLYEYKPIGMPISGPMASKNITKISGGGATTMFLDTDDNCYGVGYNNKGQLGVENVTQVETPILISDKGNLAGKSIRDVSVGYRHTFFLTTEGEVFSTGMNEYGQLCLGYHEKDEYTPKHVTNYTGDWHSVSCGFYHTLLLHTSGSVFGCGLNGISQLGNGLLKDEHLPLNISQYGDIVGKGIIQVVGGYYHSLFLDSNGNAYGVGFNGFGQLGTTDTDSPKFPKSISNIATSPLYGKTLIQLSSKGHFSLFLTDNGEVYAAGHNMNGQLGNGRLDLLVSTPFWMNSMGHAKGKKIIDVSAGFQFSLLLDEDRILYWVGSNLKGQGMVDPAIVDLQYTTKHLWMNVSVFSAGLATTFVLDEVPCQEGQYVNISTSTCHMCDEGHYCLLQHIFHEPKPCRNGYWSKQGSSKPSDCVPCTPGYVCLAGVKTPCQIGKWSTDGLRCIQCAVGFYCNGEGKKSIDPFITFMLYSPLFIFALLITCILVLCCCTIILCCTATFCIHSARRKLHYNTEKMSSLLRSYEMDYELDIMDPDIAKVKSIVKNSLLEIQIGEINVFEKIGSGGGDSIVYRGEWNEMEVAVKLFKATRLTGEGFHEEFQNELIFMNGLRHPRLVTLYGCCIQYPRFGLVMEYCGLGSVYDNIENGYIQGLEKHTIYQLLIEICEGMIFLHKRGVVHRDLKNANVLLTKSGEAKIADFGLSQHMSNVSESSMTGAVGTSYYAAPEVVRRDSTYSNKCDIYSFSIMMIEIVSGKSYPYPSSISPFQVQGSSSVDETFRPNINLIRESRFPEMEDVIVKSWQHDPDARPSFEELIDILKELKFNLANE